jgi:hypothetical protein
MFGGDAVLTAGNKGRIEVSFAMTISGWSIFSDATASAVVDVKKSSYGDYPTVSSICGTDKPTLSTQRKNQNLTLTDWTTSISAGDVLEFILDSVSDAKAITVSIRGTKV